MKHAITFLSALLYALASWGQSVATPHVVSFMGEYIYSVSPIAYGLSLVFEENSNKCDPVKGMVTLEEQLFIFTDAAKKFGIDANEMDPIVTGSNMGPFTRLKRFRVILPTKALSDSLRLLCTEKGVRIEGQFYLLDQIDPANEVEKAVSALGDANQQANLLANLVGKKVARVISIDNCMEGSPPGKGNAATTYYSDYYYDSNYDDYDDEYYLLNNNDRPFWYGELYKDKVLLPTWEGADFLGTKSYKGVYRLRVTYLLE